MTDSSVPDWVDGTIDGVISRYLTMHADERGWLAEIFRKDELPLPAMGYLTMTMPGVTRGPHEHVKQQDMFLFPGGFVIFLWDGRPNSPTYGKRMKIKTIAGAYLLVIVPPGVVHAYRNIANNPAQSMNFPDQLYRGEGRKEEVDEIRHEEQEDSVYVPW